MSTYSQYKKLEKPVSSERYDVNVFNRTTDMIDSELHRLDLKNQSQDELLATKEALNITKESLEHEVERAAVAEKKLSNSLQTEISRAANAERQLEEELNSLEIGAVSIDNETVQRDIQDRLSIPALSRVFRGEIKIISSSEAHLHIPLYTDRDSIPYVAETITTIDEENPVFSYAPKTKSGRIEMIADPLPSELTSIELASIRIRKSDDSETTIPVLASSIDETGKYTASIEDAEQIEISDVADGYTIDFTYYTQDTSMVLQEGDLFFCDINKDGVAFSCRPTTFSVIGKNEVANNAGLYTTNYITGNTSQKSSTSTTPYLSYYSSSGASYDHRKGFTITRYRGLYSGRMHFQDFLNGYTDYSTAYSSSGSSLATTSAVYNAYYYACRNEMLNHTLATFSSIGTGGTNISLTHWAEYLLVLTSHNASTGAVYGATARVISTPKVSSSTANVTSITLATSTNAGFTITLGNFTVNVKASSATYEVSGAIYRLK